MSVPMLSGMCTWPGRWLDPGTLRVHDLTSAVCGVVGTVARMAVTEGLGAGARSMMHITAAEGTAAYAVVRTAEHAGLSEVPLSTGTAAASQIQQQTDYTPKLQQTLTTAMHRHRNPILKKHRSIKLFQTLNQARTIWDPCHKNRGLLGGHLNIRSITPKREQLEHLLINSNIDFLGLTETWLKSSSPEAAVTLQGYNVYRRDRLQGRGGGVLLYVKDAIKCTQIIVPDEISIEFIGVNMSLSVEMSFTVICLYRPPSAKVDFYTELKTLLTHCDINKEVILLGDFNVNWDNKSDRKKLKEITDHFGFTQIIDDPTRITSRSKT